MFNVLVTNPEGRKIIFRTVEKKSDAKKMVKELRKKGRKAEFVTARNILSPANNLELEFLDDDNEEEKEPVNKKPHTNIRYEKCNTL